MNVDPTAIDIDVDEVDRDVVIIRVSTPRGVVEILGQVSLQRGELVIKNAHIQGLTAGSLGRSLLNAIGHKLLEISNVRRIVVFGAVRTTGRRPGRKPRPIRFPS